MGIAGDYPGLRDLQGIFNQAGLNCKVYSRPGAMKWSKLITNLLGNASSAILDLSPAAIYAHPGLYQMELDQIRECLQVMRKLGLPVVNLPGVPVKLLTGIIQSTPPSISQRLLSKMIGGGRGDKMPSFHIDLYSGRGKSEIGDLNGAVVRAGKEAGIDTPVNRFLINRLSELIAGQLPLDHYHGHTNLFLTDLSTCKTQGSLS
jgi:2-dehydropantoate 2-reductase